MRKNIRKRILQLGIRSLRRVSGKLQVWQTHTIDEHLIGAYIVRGFEAFCPGVGNEIVLIDAVAAHPQTTH
jgi:hypothetical protein